MTPLDLTLFRAIHIDLHRGWLDPIFWAISSTGLGWVQAIVVLSLLLLPKWKPLVWPLILSTAISGWLVADGLKALIPRPRPSQLPWAHAQESFFGNNSFPSGHTTTAFALATMLILLRRDKWSLLAIPWAMLVGFSRVYRGVHWPTDTLAGACCGIATSCVLYLLTTRKSTTRAKSQAK